MAPKKRQTITKKKDTLSAIAAATSAHDLAQQVTIDAPSAQEVALVEDQDAQLFDSNDGDGVSECTVNLLEKLTKPNNVNESLVCDLISRGADVHRRLSEPWDRAYEGYEMTIGATPLHFAARRGLRTVCNKLLGANANVDTQTEVGTTPMMAAVMFNKRGVVEILLKAKASTGVMEQNGLTAIDLAILEANTDIVMMLSEAEKLEEEQKEVGAGLDPLDMVGQSEAGEEESDVVSLVSGSRRVSGAVSPTEGLGLEGDGLIPVPPAGGLANKFRKAGRVIQTNNMMAQIPTDVQRGNSQRGSKTNSRMTSRVGSVDHG